jgi:hypothetical protein
VHERKGNIKSRGEEKSEHHGKGRKRESREFAPQREKKERTSWRGGENREL